MGFPWMLRIFRAAIVAVRERDRSLLCLGAEGQLKRMTVLIHPLPSVLLRWRGPQKTRPEPPIKEPGHRTAPPATPSWLLYPRLVLLVLWLWQPLLCIAVGTARPGPWLDREEYSAPWPEHQRLYRLQRPVERGLPRSPHEQLLLRRLEALQDLGRSRRCGPYSRW